KYSVCRNSFLSADGKWLLNTACMAAGQSAICWLSDTVFSAYTSMALSCAAERHCSSAKIAVPSATALPKSSFPLSPRVDEKSDKTSHATAETDRTIRNCCRKEAHRR